MSEEEELSTRAAAKVQEAAAKLSFQGTPKA